MINRPSFRTLLLMACCWNAPARAAHCEGGSAIACYEGVDKSGRSSSALFDAALQALGAAKTPAQTQIAQQAIRDAFDPAMSDQRAVQCNDAIGGFSNFQTCLKASQPPEVQLQSTAAKTSGRHFASVGAFEIIRFDNPARCVASRLDYSRNVTLFFEVNPRHVIALMSNDWHVPAGVYPVKIGWVEFIPQNLNANGSISKESGGKAIVIKFETGLDVERLVDKGWLSFDIGSHEFMFNMGASSVVSELLACETHDIDPFSSMK